MTAVSVDRKSLSKFFKVFSLLLIIVGLSSPGFAGSYKWKQQKEDVAHILSKGKPLEPQPLDLSHPREYRYLIQQLKLAGVTAKTAPKFFEHLQAERKRHADPTYVKKAHAHSLATMTPIAATNGIIKAANLMTSVGNTGTGSNVVASGVSSINGGTVQTNLTMSLYDANNRLISQGTASSGSGKGQYNLVSASGASDSAAINASMLYTYLSNDGKFHTGTVQAATDDLNVTIVNTAPVYTRGQTSGDILACMNRHKNNKSDCDYWAPGGTEIVLPSSGSMNFNNPIEMTNGVPTNGNVTFRLIHETEGGACVFPGATSADFFQAATYSGTSIAWNIQPQNFSGAKTCMPSGTTALSTLAIQVNVTVDGKITPLVGVISSSGAAAVNDNVVQIPPIEIQYGCLVAGTMVETTNGLKAIENIVAGQDRVVTDEYNTTSSVSKIITGTEDYVIKIKTDKNQSIQMTRHHPVLMAGLEIKLARQIGIGDEIRTREGLATVTALSRELYKGKIYNLVVEPTDDISRQRGNTFFADGVLVGDNKMQSIYEKAFRSPRQMTSLITPHGWELDDKNILARQKRAAN
jgi:hypothetical protein